MYLNPFAAYRMYMATKLHFSSDKYNMLEQGGRVNTNEAAFKKRRGVELAITRLAKKYPMEDFVQYIMANILAGDKNGGLFGGDGEDRYAAWKKKIQSLSYFYKQDLVKLREQDVGAGLSPIWTSLNGQHPLILREYLAGTVTIETLVILEQLYKYCDTLDEALSYDPLWKETGKLIRKYIPFLAIDKEQYEQITETIFN